MAYTKKRNARKSLKSTKSGSMKSKMASKMRSQSDKQRAMQTGYARAVLDPQNGPLVGVPQFVPVDTHRVRVKACGSVTLTDGGRIFLNPCAMGAKDTACITAFNLNSIKAVTDAAVPIDSLATNAPYASTDYMVTSPDTAYVTAANINNPDGVRSRVVGAIFTIRPISNSQVRDGIIVALHEKHHKTLEDFTSSLMSVQENAIVKSCSSGNSVSLLYRPVKPEEVDELQFASNRLNGHVFVSNASNSDGSVSDAYPGYMAFNWEGTGTQKFWVEAHAIIEYAGEVVTTLATPTHFGAAIKASPSDVRHVSDAADSMEGQQGKNDAHPKIDVLTRGGLDPRHNPIHRPGAVVYAPLPSGTVSLHIGPSEEVTRFTAIPKDSTLIETSYLYEVYRQPNGDIFVWWKGTTVPALTKQSGKEWAEDFLAMYVLPKDWEDALNHIQSEYGRESSNVHHAGYSRGGGLAEFMGGTGYGAWTPYTVQTDKGFEDEKAGDFVHDAVVMPMSSSMRKKGKNTHSFGALERAVMKRFFHYMRRD